MKNLLEKIKSFYTDEATKKKAFIITGGAVLGIILIVVLIIVLSSGGKKENTETNEKPTETVAENKATPTLAPTPTTSAQESTPTPMPTPTDIPENTPSPTPDLAEIHKAQGEVQSHINGNWVKEEIANQRPYSMMFNNISIANPQSGIGCADILYEILVEGGITRCMGIFENLTEESSCKDRMGSVRSARHYFVSIASEYDSIFIHFGETTYATKKLKALKQDNLEGMYSEGSTVFYRDKSIKAPHNAFAHLAGIKKAIENKKYRTEHEEGFVPQHFAFAYPEVGKTSIDKVIYDYKVENGLISEEMPSADETSISSGSGEGSGSGEVSGGSTADENSGTATSENETASSEENANLSGSGEGADSGEQTGNDEDDSALIEKIDSITPATYVKLGFSEYTKPYLTYDETTKLYTRYQFGGEHIDYNTKEALKFNNIIIQIVEESNRDKNGYQDIEGYSDKKGHNGKVSGPGYYICEGKCIEIKWDKDEKNYTCNYYTMDGEKLTIRPGKTFIAVYPNFRVDKLEIN